MKLPYSALNSVPSQATGVDRVYDEAVDERVRPVTHELIG
jgi:hypothetical protein